MFRDAPRQTVISRAADGLFHAPRFQRPLQQPINGGSRLLARLFLKERFPRRTDGFKQALRAEEFVNVLERMQPIVSALERRSEKGEVVA